MTTFNYEFEELPLVIADGIEAAFINGRAEIEYSRDGLWHTGSVSVEGFGDRVDGKRTWPQVPAPVALADIIVHRIENEWSGKVQDAVNEQIAEDRDCAADAHAERLQERMLEDM